MTIGIKIAEIKEFSFKLFIKNKVLLAIFTLFSLNLFASETINSDSSNVKSSHNTGFDAGSFIMHHIGDAHEIHFFTLNEGKENEKHFSLYLPIIIKDENGFKIFSSSHFYHNSYTAEIDGKHKHYYLHDGYLLFDEKIYKAEGDNGINIDESGKIANDTVLDLSLTKSVVGIFLTIIILALLFGSAARKYKKNPIKAPSGLQSLLEPLVLFIRDEVAIPSIGKEKADRFVPFLLTTFFFIWLANILGLIPFIGGFNVMGTLGVTIVLATVVFIITNINGKSNYWTHILWPHGVPFPIKLILVPIEILGIFMKPMVLMIRLTANITAGHIIILAFTCLIFIFGQQSAGGGYGAGVGSVLFMIFMYFIELLVVFLQAYVFTLLTAMYFGSAIEEPHHH
ncbi:MAG: F0F1 ATP synthase subunit A [Bacteroidia bacterium]|nr:F0F1 ATP synthase subunit A [Bacteroidia bacterium]